MGTGCLVVRGNFGLHLLQMGHQEAGAVKRRIGKGQLLDGEVGGSLKVAAADYNQDDFVQ